MICDHKTKQLNIVLLRHYWELQSVNFMQVDCYTVIKILLTYITGYLNFTSWLNKYEATAPNCIFLLSLNNTEVILRSRK